MVVRRSLAAVAAALVLSACQTAQAPSAPVVQPLDQALTAAAVRSEAPGLIAAIFRDGEIVELFAWGGAICDGSGTANPFAAYEIGSISKHLTAVAIMQLVEQRRVRAPIADAYERRARLRRSRRLRRL
jgi:CubicO group peptidase (beta-lactamase class C family)